MNRRHSVVERRPDAWRMDRESQQTSGALAMPSGATFTLVVTAVSGRREMRGAR